MAKTTTASSAARPRRSETTGRDYHVRRIEKKGASLKKQVRRAQGVDEAGGEDTGGAEDHALRKVRRSAALSHDTEEKIDASKLRLHIVKVRREIEALRKRLTAWDDVEEKERERRERAEAEKKRKAMEDEANGVKRRKRGRLGPETWKLRGAARPAWEVYDFDTRYVDPHLKAHEEAREKARRIRNVLSTHRGRFGEEGGDDPPPQPYCRRFLSLLSQLGHLSSEAGRITSAREAFLECVELEGTEADSVVVTPARSRLMRMYVESNRPGSARRLWERLPHDRSAWVRYSAALLEYVSWSVLEEEGSSEGTAVGAMRKAIECNPYCAYHLAFHDTFREAMEYGDEVEDAEAGTAEEAVEYCHSEQMGAWLGTEGAVEWCRGVVLALLSDEDLDVPAKVRLESWEEDLKKAEDDYVASRQLRETEEEDEDGQSDDEDEPDVLMYTGMFRTAMDMLQEAGAFVEANDEN
eukprot:CAMPEP_0183303612 /NCGR_PEP_ID=MMETSP0160_2-20130417/8979_1 /TAXON_ID=2839 ORGANISM="Odontella Sinensis, Strain Grunow 1884" /NCGR_SAMPLE_ID=MMETSP0160_2 /ASSEMBLY_ACC=CAM_ASM_000250 /LENGTH=467 /DNA_ID=CAMNT_0025466535 /DNA_START=12 /DNA_END=1415 /DNA_ORIENTATION=-